MRELLTTLYNIKKRGLANENVDERLLQICLQDAQDINLTDEIGLKFVRDLQEKRNKQTLNNYETELINGYIIPYLSKVVDRRATIATSNRIRNAGTGSVNATEFRQNTIEENRQFRNEIMWDEKVLAKEMHSYIKDNITHFPLYKHRDNCYNSTSNKSLINKIFTI